MDVIFDIDGTLSDCEHRRHHVTGEKKDWEAFLDGCAKDPPIEPMCELARRFIQDGKSRVAFLTGRMERARAATDIWLEAHVDAETVNATAFPRSMTRFPSGANSLLLMRPDDDYRPDFALKLGFLRELQAGGFQPALVFDDRQSVVDMWRSEGLICAQVAPGDF